MEHETDAVLEDLRLAHCWVLRRHLLGFSWYGCSWPGPSNASRSLMEVSWWVGVVVVRHVGVWLCVECCIVDASILLW